MVTRSYHLPRNGRALAATPFAASTARNVLATWAKAVTNGGLRARLGPTPSKIRMPCQDIASPKSPPSQVFGTGTNCAAPHGLCMCAWSTAASKHGVSNGAAVDTTSLHRMLKLVARAA